MAVSSIEWTDKTVSRHRENGFKLRVKVAAGKPRKPRFNGRCPLGAVTRIAAGHYVTGAAISPLRNRINVVPCCCRIGAVRTATAKGVRQVRLQGGRNGSDATLPRVRVLAPTRSVCPIVRVAGAFVFRAMLSTKPQPAIRYPGQALPTPAKSKGLHRSTSNQRRARPRRRGPARTADVAPAVRARNVDTKVSGGKHQHTGGTSLHG